MTRRDTAWPVVKSLRPGQAGTLRLQNHYGATLMCVRYREDPKGRTRRVTVELVIQEKPIRRNQVWVSIPMGQTELRAIAIAQGARWDPKNKLWRMRTSTAKLLDLDIPDSIQKVQL
jgi:hypothetical protein